MKWRDQCFSLSLSRAVPPIIPCGADAFHERMCFFLGVEEMEADSEHDEHSAQSAAEAVLDCARFGEDDDLGTLRSLLCTDPSLVDVRDDLGRTPMHMAAANGHVAVAEVLKSFHAAPNVPNHDGSTALHYAALRNEVGMVRWLLSNGWLPSLPNRWGKTPLREIADKQFDEVEVLLIQYDDELDRYHCPESASVEVGESPEECETSNGRDLVVVTDTPVPSYPGLLAAKRPTAGCCLDDIE